MRISRSRGGMRISRSAKGGGIGVMLLLLIAAFFGIDPSALLQGVSSTSVSNSGVPQSSNSAADNTLRDFVSVVLADTEDTWHELFRQLGGTYQEPTLVLFSGAVESACGFTEAAVGPFYCPGDQKVYIDLRFYQDLRDQYQAPGDFAQAYVIAHEIGHHVQNLLGIAQQIQALRGRLGPIEANALSVRQELQADCFAGIWAHHAHRSRHILEAGDIEEGLNAASAIGDDRMQRQARGYVTPESFTHGSSAQRVRWFKRGLVSGDLQSCDTFNVAQL
jgi:predicted metalloprotease